MIATSDQRIRQSLCGAWAEVSGAILAAGFLAFLVNSSAGAYSGAIAFAGVTTLLFIAARDVRTLKASNRIVLPAIGLTLLLTVPLGGDSFLQALGGGVLSLVLFVAIALAGRGAMGFGDVKVATLCGVVVGLNGLLPFLFFTFFTGAAIAAFVLGFSIRSRKDVVAFTPFMALGVLCSLVFYPLYLVS